MNVLCCPVKFWRTLPPLFEKYPLPTQAVPFQTKYGNILFHVGCPAPEHVSASGLVRRVRPASMNAFAAIVPVG